MARRSLAVAATLSVAAPQATAAAAQLSISATVGAGPYLVGEQIPVEVTVANTGDADATAVTAGQQRVLTVRGVVSQWRGGPAT